MNLQAGNPNLMKKALRVNSKVRSRMGMLFQGAALFDSLSVRENVAYPLREHFEHDWGFDRSSWVTACELAKAEGQVWLYADKTTCDPVDDYAPRVVMVAPGRLYY